jgi:uncharacterized linocin/CFP29 family protein
MAELNWSDAQWQKVNDGVTEAFGKASVASAFLPCYGPLAGSAETVRNDRVMQGGVGQPPLRIKLDADHDAANLTLINLTVQVSLSSEQVADETLSNAMLAFRRAANILALEEDRIVFEGNDRGDQNSVYVANSIHVQKGLADAGARRGFTPMVVAPAPGGAAAGVNATGLAVVSAVVNAIRRLEDNYHSAPFACVLGNELFEAVQQPSFAFVLPSDRITPLLKGPLLRSGKMNENAGIVVSLGAHAVDVVVGTPPTVQFLQRTEQAKFLFRVYTRFALRIRDKDKPPVAGFMLALTEKPGPAIRLESLAAAAVSVATERLELARAEKEVVEAENELAKKNKELKRLTES